MRYRIYDEIASGGMATVHLGRLLGPAGFSRTVAIKRLHPHHAKDPEFVSMFLDEARLAARIRHPNVVPTLDVVSSDGDLFLVMEYVQGESLAALLRAAVKNGETVSPRIAASIMCNVLYGLHAAHSTTDPRGLPLDVVHRDVSPQNILVGTDGVARVLDFGVAKALGRLQTTQDGRIKGKLGYMAPEQFQGSATQKTDIYAASVVLWEMLAGRRLCESASRDPAHVMAIVLKGDVSPPSAFAPISPELDAVVLRGLCLDPEGRFATALEMASALAAAVEQASPSEVSRWVESLASETLAAHAQQVSAIESAPLDGEAAPMRSQHGAPPQARPPSVATASMEFDASPTALDAVAAVVRDPSRDSGRIAQRSTFARRARSGGAIALIAAIAAVALHQATRSEPAGNVSSTAVSAPTAPPMPTLPIPPTPAPPAASAPQAAPDIPSVTASVVHAETSAPSPRRRIAPVRAAKPACNPPYREVMVGENVRRVPKPECL